MATVHLTLTDTPTGGVSLYSSFKPSVGNPCTPAQGAALEILARTGKQWGVEPTHRPPSGVCRCHLREEAPPATEAQATCKHLVMIKKASSTRYTCVECSKVVA